MGIEHIRKAWQRLNREMFDKMLESAHFNMTTRGKTPIRHNGDGVYIVNLGVDITENDILVEMCYHLDNRVHRHDVEPTKQIMLEAVNRGYVETGESEIIHEAQVIEKRKSYQQKWSCGCTIIRCCVELEATCNKCSNLFIKED